MDLRGLWPGRFGRHGLTASWFAPLALLALLAAGCRQDMHDQPKYTPLEPSTFFANGTSARGPVEGTVARGQLREDAHLYTGKLPESAASRRASAEDRQAGAAGPGSGEEYVTTFPFPMNLEMLDRGQELYDVFCSVCHDRLGAGNGMVVRRGYRRPQTFHSDRLRDAPVGYFFDVMTNGFGAMQDYAAPITVEDRWKIVAYIRALQLSQGATIDDVPAEQRGELERGS